MHTIVTLSGSPSAVSRSTCLLDFAEQFLTQNGFRIESIVIRDLDAQDLLHGRYDSPALQQEAARIAGAAGVIVTTPVYKAAYTGVLKVFLDVLPPNALAGKVILPCATGAAPTHALIIDYALKPVLAALGAQHLLSGVYLVDSQIPKTDAGTYQLSEQAETALQTALEEFVKIVRQLSAA